MFLAIWAEIFAKFGHCAQFGLNCSNDLIAVVTGINPVMERGKLKR